MTKLRSSGENRKICDFLRNQDECAHPAKPNVKKTAPTLYERGWRRVGSDVCIYAENGTYDECVYRTIEGKEV